MTDHDPVIAALAEVNPVEPTAAPDPEDRAQADAIRRRVMSSAGRSRRRVVALAPVVSTLVVLVVIAMFLRIGGARDRTASPAHANERSLILQALPTVQTPVITSAAMAREVGIVGERLTTLRGTFHVTRAPGERIRVTVGRDVSAAERARILPLLSQTAPLYFYDWEATALTPNGQTAASQLLASSKDALRLSQGTSFGPGMPGAGSMSLYQAVQLAARQPAAPASPRRSRLGPEYYMFGTPGSSACAAAANAAGTTLVSGEPCLLSGPVVEPNATSRAQAIRDLAAGLPAGVSASQGQVMTVPQGTVVLQAANPSAKDSIAFTSPDAQFFVLKDNVSLSGKDITRPQASTDSSGAPDVQFDFTKVGAAKFQEVTAQIARRGAHVSVSGNTNDQHFAVALDNQLVDVASIDFKQYPDGIIETAGSGGADITGGLTTTSAKAVAAQLRYGGLPLNLRISH